MSTTAQERENHCFTTHTMSFGVASLVPCLPGNM